MRKSVSLFIACLIAVASIGQSSIPQDTTQLFSQINTQIVPNGSKGITALQLNHILNGITQLMTQYSLDSCYRINDTLFFTGKKRNTIKVVLNSGGAPSEIDPTVPSVAKALNSADTARWNHKQDALTPGVNMSIIDGVISALNTTALWNSDKLQGRSVSSTAPFVGQLLQWNGTAWEPATSLKVDSVKRRLDSVFYYKNGTEIFAFKDSVGTGGGSTYTPGNGIQFNSSAIELGDLTGTTTIGGNHRLFYNGLSSFNVVSDSLSVLVDGGILLGITANQTIGGANIVSDGDLDIVAANVEIGANVDFKYGFPIRLPRQTSDGALTGSPLNGMAYYNTTSNKFRAYENGTWKDIISPASAPPGSDQQVIINDGGAFGAVAGVTINKTQKKIFADSLQVKIARADSVFNLKLISDSGYIANTRADSSLVIPLRDSLYALARKGSIRYDANNNISYWDGARWSFLSSLSNSLIPNRPNMRIAAGVIRPTITGTDIDWRFLSGPDGHDSVLFTGIGKGNTLLGIRYPICQKVITFIAIPDETLQLRNISVGTSVEVDSAKLFFFINQGTEGGFLVGNGTSWSKSNRISGWTVDQAFYSGFGIIGFNYPLIEKTDDIENIQYAYTGPNNWRIRKHGGYGAYYGALYLLDEFGNAVTDAPTTNDVIQIMTSRPRKNQINPNIVDGSGIQAEMFTPNSNIWLFAIFEY